METEGERKAFEQFCIQALAPLANEELTKNVAPAAHKCSCKRTKCLKRYCQCFALNKLCDGCECKNCYNKAGRDVRNKAVKKVLRRWPQAFARLKRCSCKKVGCQKKYCSCFRAGIPCSRACKCVGCLNTSCA